MKIAVDCRTILNPGYGEAAGVGHYTTSILREMLKLDTENKYVLFFGVNIAQAAVDDLIAGRPNAELRRFPFYSFRKAFPVVYAHAFLAHAVSKEKADVFFAPAGFPPMFYRGRSVITVHDLAIFRHPEWFPESMIGQTYSKSLLVPRSLRAASEIIVPSASTANDIRLYFNHARKKTKVIPHGVARRDRSEYVLTDTARKKFDLSGKYLLSLCTIEPRKNIEAAVRAFDRWLIKTPALAKQYTFAVAGGRGWKYEPVFQAIKEINDRWQKYAGRDVVQYLGYVSRKEKWALLSNAHAFVYPSKYEGFGLPVLEAMSVETPVITSRLTSLPEVGGDAVLYIDPDDPGPMVNLFDRLLDEDYRLKIARLGLERAQQFTWERSAQKTLEVLSRVGSVAE
jgi:glycosyltransferase involved in cell wall biosynthesis